MSFDMLIGTTGVCQWRVPSARGKRNDSFQGNGNLFYMFLGNAAFYLITRNQSVIQLESISGYVDHLRPNSPETYKRNTNVTRVSTVLARGFLFVYFFVDDCLFYESLKDHLCPVFFRWQCGDYEKLGYGYQWRAEAIGRGVFRGSKTCLYVSRNRGECWRYSVQRISKTHSFKRE